jgi:hypothetical protein
MKRDLLHLYLLSGRDSMQSVTSQLVLKPQLEEVWLALLLRSRPKNPPLPMPRGLYSEEVWVGLLLTSSRPKNHPPPMHCDLYREEVWIGLLLVRSRLKNPPLPIPCGFYSEEVWVGLLLRSKPKNRPPPMPCGLYREEVWVNLRTVLLLCIVVYIGRRFE